MVSYKPRTRRAPTRSGSPCMFAFPLYASRRYSTLSHVKRRRFVLLVAGAAIVLSSSFIWLYQAWAWSSSPQPQPQPQPQPSLPRHPPLYTEYHNAELQLPQHNWSRAHPGPHEKFFYTTGHSIGLGWGNALQEHLFTAYLNYKAGRSFVFDNFTWREDGTLYTDFNGHEIPSKVPYSVLIRGPTVGGPFPQGDNAPLAVARDYFNHVCPEKVNVHREHTYSTAEMIDDWSRVLNSMDEPCVQTSEDVGQIFSYYHIWGVRTSVRESWPGLASSPILTHLGWSLLVELGFDLNRDLFLGNSSIEPYLTSLPFTTNAERYTKIPGLMAIHIRRGDYEEHCKSLAASAEDFVAMNTLPGLVDQFTVPEIAKQERPNPDNLETREHYRKHCYPTLDEIVNKIKEVRNTPEGRDIRRMYIMTNGQPEYLRELKQALWRADEWDQISTSRDLQHLSWEQKYSAHAVDQLVAQRAQVLIGNGFSTLTSHAVMMRLANKFTPASTRFW